jgi:hypothetical protein
VGHGSVDSPQALLWPGVHLLPGTHALFFIGVCDDDLGLPSITTLILCPTTAGKSGYSSLTYQVNYNRSFWGRNFGVITVYIEVFFSFSFYPVYLFSHQDVNLKKGSIWKLGKVVMPSYWGQKPSVFSSSIFPLFCSYVLKKHPFDCLPILFPGILSSIHHLHDDLGVGHFDCHCVLGCHDNYDHLPGLSCFVGGKIYDRLLCCHLKAQRGTTESLSRSTSTHSPQLW